MHKRLDRYLVTAYQPLYRDRYGDRLHTAMCWGFEVGDGWFRLIKDLSHLLCYNWTTSLRSYNDLTGRLGQLRFAGSPENQHNKIVTQEDVDQAFQKMVDEYHKVPVVVQVKEKFGTLRFYTHGATEQQYTYIDFAEHISGSICERCGSPGKVRGGSWLTTLCAKHAIQR